MEEGGNSENLRFFTPGPDQRRSKFKPSGSASSLPIDDDEPNLEALELERMDSDDDVVQGKCLTLRVIQKFMPCLKKKGLWESSQGDVLSSDSQETRYPLILRILEFWNLFEILFVVSCLASVFLFFFSFGFLSKSRILWGIIHSNNAVYTAGLFAQWLRILITSKYGTTNQSFTKHDIILALITVFPLDLIVLIIYSLNRKDVESSEDNIIITFSRLNYLFRVYYVSKYFAVWENQLVVSDFVMFIIRTTLYSTFLVHIYACIFHHIACKSFSLKHFLMTPQEATADVCEENSWIRILSRENSIILNHPYLNVLGSHYLASLYWAVTVSCGLGYGDIKVFLTSDLEIVFTAVTQITAWIFTLAVVSGTLTSLLVEGDTERESYLTRRFAIKNYLDFTPVSKSIIADVKNFYDYLWQRRKGIMHLDLIDTMPSTIKSEVFYDVNKFVFDQLPLLRDMDQAFMMNLSVHMQHTFHLSGEILFRKFHTGERMHYVLKGYLEILSDDESRVIANIRSGSAIGEIYLIHSYPQVATVRCGSDCDILVLTKKNFREHMESYPELWPTFKARLKERFEQSELLLTLCEKNNQSTDLGDTEEGLDLPGFSNNFQKSRNPEADYDGISLRSDQIRKLTQAELVVEKEKLLKLEKRKKSLEEEAYKALEVDVTRAGSLAKDLGIPRPPLFVTAPTTALNKPKLSTATTETGSIKLRITPLISCLDEQFLFHMYRIFTATTALTVIWYYLHAIAFRTQGTVIATFFFHFTDLIFGLNFWIDMSQVVVTPQKTLEQRKEIFQYRAHRFSSYLRLFSFLPWEYLLTPLLGASMYNVKEPEKEFVYTALKLNRALVLIVVFQVIRELESVQVISVIKMFLIKYSIATIFCIHFFAVVFRLVVEYVYGWKEAQAYPYEAPFYWAAQVTTGTGFGDMPYASHLEVINLTVGVMIGTMLMIYYGAKDAALLANSARRRVSFKQTYYCLKTFMKQRKFPKELANRVTLYYQMQWQIHEGTLIPTDKSVIWDAPDSLINSVTMSQARDYLARVPLVAETSKNIQQKFARVLKQYFVPPNETVLYPYDKRRELYIIVKGTCSVLKDGKRLGSLREGQYFGLPGVIFGVNKKYEIVTSSHCHFFCILFDDYVKLARSNKSILRDYRILRGETKVSADEIKKSSTKSLPSSFDEILRYDEEDLPSDDSDLSSDEEIVVQETPALLNVNSNDDDENGAEQPTKKRKTSFFRRRLKARFFRWSFLYSILFKYFLFPKAINPSGEFMKIWRIFRTTSAVLLTIFFTAQASLPFVPGRCLVITFIFDVIAWFDLYLMFNVGYMNSDGVIVQSTQLTSVHYLERTFLIDLISCFPIDYFFLPQIPKEFITLKEIPLSAYVDNFQVRLMAYCRLPRILQCYRLFQAGLAIEKNIFKSLTFITLIDVVPVMFLFMHFITCILVSFSCHWRTGIEEHRCPNSSIPFHFRPVSVVHSHSALKSPDNFDIFDPFTLYVTGLYWTTQTALSVGFGDFVLYDLKLKDLYPMSNRTFSIIVIILGTVVSMHLGSKLTACMVGEDSRRIAIREQMKVIFDFLMQYNVSNQDQRRVREVYFNAWDKTKGISPTDLFVALHPALKSDVTKQLYEVHLRKSPLFKDLDEAGMRMLSSQLKEVYYPEGEYIMRNGDLNDDVFIVSTGIVVGYGAAGEILSYMAPGSLFGEISALFQVQRLYSAVTATGADVFVFERSHFLEFLNMYPPLRKSLEEACKIHYSEMMEGAAHATGVEFILTASKGVDFNEDVRHSIIAKESGGVPRSKSEPAIGEHALSVNISLQEAVRGDAALVPDPLRVALKMKEGYHGGRGAEEEKSESLEESYDRNNKWWSFILTFGRIPRDEMGFIHIFQEKNKCNILNFVVNPLCPVSSKAIFVCFCLLLTCLSCSLASFELAFQPRNYLDHTKVILLVITVVVEIFFLLRFIGNFHLAYFNEDGVLVTKLKDIIKRYAKRYDGLVLDALTLPYYFIVEPFNPYLASMLKGLQLFRMILFWRYLNETESELRMKASMIKIVKISIVLSFIFHFCACVWYWVSCSGLICEKDSWMERSIERMRIDLQLGPRDPSPVVSIGSRYFLSIFYVSTAITFTGLNYIEPAQVKEIGITIFFIFTTVFVIGFLIGEITQCLASQVASKIHYEHELSVLQDHFLSLGLRRSKVKEVHSYFKLIWQKCKGIPYADIFEGIPYSLTTDIKFSIYCANIKNSRILCKLDDSIIRQICSKISHEVYLPGCRIVRSGDVCDSMYFIKKGEVVIMDENQNVELCVETLFENECFGEVKLLLPKEQYRFSYIARLETEVGVLGREDLQTILNNYPLILREIEEKAEKIKHHRALAKEEEQRAKKIELGILTAAQTPGPSSVLKGKEKEVKGENAVFEKAHSDFLKRGKIGKQTKK